MAVRDSGFSVEFPRDASPYATTESTHFWLLPSYNIIVGLEKSNYRPLSTWKMLLETEFEAVQYDELGGITTLYAHRSDDGGLTNDFATVFNSNGFSYAIISSNVSPLSMINYLYVTASMRADPPQEEGAQLTLPLSLRAIEDEAFMNSGAQSVVIPDGCTSIGSYAFAYSQELERVDIPASVTQIDATAFNGCSKVVIYAPWGSEAIEFAEQRGIPYVCK